MRVKVDAATRKPVEKSAADRSKFQPVTEDTMASVLATWTGIPVQKLTSDESVKLLQLEQQLHERVVGQAEAARAIGRAVRRARVGLSSPTRPVASFVFSGPTGVGKTELAKALAEVYYGDERASMVRLDMSEYMERHTVSKLTGPPPGYIGYEQGGQLTEAVRRRPYNVVLFDEVEEFCLDRSNDALGMESRMQGIFEEGNVEAAQAADAKEVAGLKEASRKPKGEEAVEVAEEQSERVGSIIAAEGT